MDYKKAKRLLKRNRQGKCSPEELALLESWFNQVVKDLPEYPREIDYATIDNELKQRLHPLYQSKPRLRNTSWWIAAASVVLLGCVFAFFQWTNYAGDNEPRKFVDALPGKERAELILADGSAISLEEAKAGEIAKEGNMLIKKVANGQLVYENGQSHVEQHDRNRPMGMNEMRVPKSGQYHLVLPDGSQVWLNASSSLKYYSHYEPGQPRVVSLSGEAYFEVAKNISGKQSVPFIVKTADQEVQVLGTKFNINAYPDEPVTRTTLTEGKVMVRSLSSNAKKPLQPGQDAILQHSSAKASAGDLLVETSDTKQALAWKNGLFVFDNIGLQALMRQVARWYDVEVEMGGQKLPDERFSGEMPRNVKLSQLLEMIAIASNIKFKLELVNGKERRLIQQK